MVYIYQKPKSSIVWVGEVVYITISIAHFDNKLRIKKSIN